MEKLKFLYQNLLNLKYQKINRVTMKNIDIKIQDLNDTAIFNADYKKWSIIEKNLKFDEFRKNIILKTNEVAIMNPIFTTDSVVISVKTITVDMELNEEDAYTLANTYLTENMRIEANLYIVKDRLFLNLPTK